MKTFSDFFSFERVPFSRMPDDELFFEGDKHLQALDKLDALQTTDAHLALLSGDSGTGRTIIARQFMKRLPDDVLCIYMKAEAYTFQQVLMFLLQGIGVEATAISSEQGTTGLVNTLNKIIQDSFDTDKKVFIIIDDADNLNSEVLNNLLSLLDIKIRIPNVFKLVFVTKNSSKQAMLNIIAPQLDTSSYFDVSISELNEKELRDYVNFRLMKSGKSPVQVKSGVLKKISKITKGNPLLVNTFMERVLIAAFLENSYSIKECHLDSAVSSVNTIALNIKRRQSAKVYKIFAVLVVVGGLSFAGYSMIDKYSLLERYNKPIEVAEVEPLPSVPPTDVLPPVVETTEVEKPVEQPAVVKPTPTQPVAEPKPVEPKPVEPKPVEPEPVVTPTPAPVTPPVEEAKPVEVAPPVVAEPESVVEPTVTLVENERGNLQGVTLPVGTEVVVIPRSLNVRSLPDVKSARLGAVYLDTKHSVVEDSGEWIKINYNGKDGWLLKLYLGL